MGRLRDEKIAEVQRFIKEYSELCNRFGLCIESNRPLFVCPLKVSTDMHYFSDLRRVTHQKYLQYYEED